MNVAESDLRLMLGSSLRNKVPQTQKLFKNGRGLESYITASARKRAFNSPATPRSSTNIQPSSINVANLYLAAGNSPQWKGWGGGFSSLLALLGLGSAKF